MNSIYEERQKSLRTFLQRESQDVAVIMSPTNIYYLTGFRGEPHERFMALVLFEDKQDTLLFLPTLDVQAAEKSGFVQQLIPVSDTEDAYAIFASTVGNVASIAIEKSYVTVTNFEVMGQHYPLEIFSNVEEIIFNMRKQKTAAEIKHVRAAIALTEAGLENVLKKLTSNLTELQVKAMLEYELTMLGAEGFAFDTTVLSGENSSLPHGVSSGRVIEASDFLLIDFGIFLNGYCSDITRTFVVGDATTKQIEIYEAVLAANENALEEVRVGIGWKKIDLAARNYITEAGYGAYFTHRVGHGLGLEVHEHPSIHHENEELIEAGVLFTIEPGIYVPGLGGVRIEDDVYVNGQGVVEVLTTFPKRLISI